MASASGQATIEVAAFTVAVFLAQTLALAVGLGMELFVLTVPFDVRPWTILLSVYAHGSTEHLFANLLGLLVFGFIVERRSVRWRFHAFILATGAIAGMAEVFVGSMLGPAPSVLGISGAVFALMGYVLASNPVTDSLLAWLEVDTRVQVVLMLLVAVGITWVSRGERVALVAHFVGFFLGLVSGRAHLLRARQPARG